MKILFQAFQIYLNNKRKRKQVYFILWSKLPEKFWQFGVVEPLRRSSRTTLYFCWNIAWAFRKSLGRRPQYIPRIQAIFYRVSFPSSQYRYNRDPKELAICFMYILVFLFSCQRCLSSKWFQNVRMYPTHQKTTFSQVKSGQSWRISRFCDKESWKTSNLLINNQ